ncbi:MULTISPECIES: alpha/beta hydrolase family protein [Flavobacterium]|uniref:Alpha/beta hydrolase family protein n=1 Tax=Flavobacterium jumunjinense TaxID=998845 RepID=A0ABV5GLT5_9FLAO|nr:MULTISPECIES: prolyl oligopeptidase family serine peptidase [Flavobacterium]
MKNLNYLKVLFLLVLFTNVRAQEKKLLLKENLIELSKTPIYSRLTEVKDGQTEFKNQFKYLDSIEIYTITYLSDGLKINGLLVKPKKQGKYPCIIYNRGGNRDFGVLKIAHGAITLGQIAKEGYVVIASQYRGNGGSEGQEEFGGNDVNDITILPEVLKEIEVADTNKIGMYGWSRGGMMTYLAVTQSDKIKAAVVGGAIADNYASIEDRPEMETGVLAELITNYKENKAIELEKRSAIKWADKFPKKVPILMLHGTSDWRVKPEQSLKLALEFEKFRIPYKLIMFEGGDHGISEHKIEVDKQVLNWFDKYLKNDNPIPNMEYHGK